MMSIYTYGLFCACTQSESGQTSNISIHHIHCKHDVNIYLPPILCMHTSEISQKNNISNHHIHCKHDVNIYLPTILCMHTKRVRSNKQHQHPSYPLQT